MQKRRPSSSERVFGNGAQDFFQRNLPVHGAGHASFSNRFHALFLGDGLEFSCAELSHHGVADRFVDGQHFR